MKCCVALASVSLWSLIASAAALADPPAVNYAVPSAVTPGRATTVAFHGGDLRGVSGFWTNLPGEAMLVPDGNAEQKSDRVSYHFIVPADAQVGIYGLRIATAEGVSPMRLLMIDDLPSVVDNGSNKTPATAQEITLPIAVDGACEVESYDFYHFRGAAGQRVSVEAVAQRLGSVLDPVIRLLDTAGRELAYSDDEAGIGSDGRFAFVLPVDGDYLLEVRDIRYLGGESHRYRLRVGGFLLPTVAYPLAISRGVSTKLALVGHGVEGLSPFTVSAPSNYSGRQMQLGVQTPDGQGSSSIRLAIAAGAECVEFEPNDSPEAASPMTVPGAINGRFAAAKDRDYFQFEVAKGQRLSFAGKTRSLGSPSDLFLRLFKADGSKLGEAEDAAPEEGLITHQFEEAGTYRLMVEDLHRRGGPEHAYRVEVTSGEPGFTLALDAEKFDVPRGGVFATKVTVTRRDYKGPITLSVEGAGDGMMLSDATIGENKNDTTLTVRLPESCEPGKLLLVRVVGKAKIGEREVSAVASTQPGLKAALGNLAYPPDDLIGQLALGVGPVFPDFFKLSVEPKAVEFPQLVATATFTVKLAKSNGFDEEVKLTVDQLPANFTAEVKPIAKGKNSATVTLTGPAALPEGDYVFRIRGSATHKSQPKEVVVSDVPLQVIPPLAVAVETAGTLAPGGKQAVNIRVRRFGDDKGPIKLAFRDLPPGVVAPADAVIPEGKSEATVELMAAMDAPPVKFDRLIVSAAARVREREIRVDSPPTTLEIK